MNLETHVEQIRHGIRAGYFVNEASISQGIVLRLLHALSWPTYDTGIVCPEYSLQNRRVDFALCHPARKPIAFVEVKQIGLSEGAERQLFEYAFHAGVPLAILTDGREWNFFLPAEQGDYGERRVYKLDIIEREVAECVARLNRYLHYDSIVSGEAIEAARRDYRNVSRARQIRQTLPRAWARLLEDQDEILIELVADRVESLCGYKPDPDTVADFLRQRALGQPLDSFSLETRTPKNPSTTVSTTTTKVRESAAVGPETIGFVLDGVFLPARNAREVLTGVFDALYARDAMILERFAALPKHGRSRRYLARNPNDLYPGRPDLSRDHSVKLDSGWWVSTNHSRDTIIKIVQMVCEVANVQFGTDLIVNVGS